MTSCPLSSPSQNGQPADRKGKRREELLTRPAERSRLGRRAERPPFIPPCFLFPGSIDRPHVQMQPLPTWERRLSYLVWIFHSLAAFLIAYNVTRGRTRPWIEHWLQPSPYFSDAKWDTADREWQAFRGSVRCFLISYSFHSLGFFLAVRFISNANILIPVIAILGFSGQIFVTSIQCFLSLGAFCVFVTIAVYFSRSKLLAWLAFFAFVLNAAELLSFNYETFTFYREFNLYLYGAVKVLNFCLHLCKNPTATYGQLWKDHIAYLGYLPYSTSLIVLFEDFREQFKTKLATQDPIPVRSVFFFGCRVAFWFFFYDLLLHFAFVHTIYQSPFSIIASLDRYSMCCISYVTGQCFHIKYVVIFGIHAFFAYLDGMRPPPPAICISRVSRYSRMWRHFDHGLYQFLKHQVYIPIMKPVLPPILSVFRTLVSLVAVFSIVVAWHGTQRNYIAWVSLSALELIIEKVGAWLWSTPRATEIRSRIGPQNSRRLIALSMLFTVIPGIFGVFFFLGNEGVGQTVFSEVLVAGFRDIFTFSVRFFDKNNAGFVLVHLLVLGYFFNNVCLDLDENKGKIKIQ